jgi:hypothetical protein
MDILVWIFAGIFLVNVVTVAILAIVVEVRQRRHQREVRELELLYEAPPARVPAAALRRPGAGLRGKRVAVATTTQGKHVAVAVDDPRRQEIVRTASFVLTVVSILIVITAALVSPTEDSDTAPMAAADGIAEDVLGARTGSGQEASGSNRRYVPADPQQGRGATDEPIDIDVPGQNIVVSGGEDAVPTVVAAAPASATSILIDWEPVTAATGYLVDRWVESAPDTDGGWGEIATTAAGISAITDAGLDPATTYYYRVTAVLEGGEEALASDVVHATTMSAPPHAPTLTGKIAGNKVILHWTDIEGETGYRIERRVSGETEWALLATKDADVVSVKDEDVSADVTYQYRVIATGLGGDSEPSNVVQVDLSISVGEEPPPAEDRGDDATEPDATEPEATEPEATEPDAAPSD